MKLFAGFAAYWIKNDFKCILQSRMQVDFQNRFLNLPICWDLYYIWIWIRHFIYNRFIFCFECIFYSFSMEVIVLQTPVQMVVRSVVYELVSVMHSFPLGTVVLPSNELKMLRIENKQKVQFKVSVGKLHQNTSEGLYEKNKNNDLWMNFRPNVEKKTN